jgi:hypothetical protein
MSTGFVIWEARKVAILESAFNYKMTQLAIGFKHFFRWIPLRGLYDLHADIVLVNFS